MKLVLCAVEEGLAAAWQTACGDLDFVTVHRGSILEVACDAVVSPANSFGFMDGGIDSLYLNYFGSEIQLAVRRQILEHHHGELLVGAADVVETHHPTIPYLIAAPTMRVPMALGDTVNPDLAARAVFLLVKFGSFLSGSHTGTPVHDTVKVIALPGFGTGVGRVPYATCARQVRQAIDDVILGQYQLPGSWAEASERHQLLYSSRVRQLQ